MDVWARVALAACRGMLSAALLLVALPAAPAVADSLQETLDRIYADNDFQAEMPGEPPAPEPTQAEVPLRIPNDNSLGGLIEIIGMAVGVMVLLAILYIVVGSATGLRFGGGRDPKQTAANAGAFAADVETPGHLSAADALARQGRHAEAIHMLLLVVVAALRESTQGSGGVSTTVREIIARAPLSGPPKGAFATLAMTAELIHFGGRSATSDRYEACRQNAHAVLAALPGARP